MAFRSFYFISMLVSAVLAQSSNPFIPPGISSACTAYLQSLDGNANFTVCTKPFTTTLQQFVPSANATAPTSSAISTALNSLCQSDEFSACPQSYFTTQLSAFYAACSVELTSTPNQVVKLTYDVLYALVPLRQAICSKDDSGKYCATHLPNASSTGTVALVEAAGSQKQTLLSQYLYVTPDTLARRDLSNTTIALAPNATTYQNTNLLFLFLQPFMQNSELCSTCTRNILTPYITFESNSPYGPGMSNSLLLAGQLPLYNNITTKCGSNFLSGAVQAAGGLSNGLVSSATPRVGSQELSTAVSAISGIVALVAASL